MSARPRYNRNPIPRNGNKGLKLTDDIDGHTVYQADLVVNDDGLKVDSRNHETWDERYDLEGDRPFVPDAIGSGVTYANGMLN